MKNKPEAAGEHQQVDGRRLVTATSSLGRKSRVSEVMMISNRSNHIPMLANIATTNHHPQVRAELGEPEELRGDDVAERHDDQPHQ